MRKKNEFIAIVNGYYRLRKLILSADWQYTLFTFFQPIR